MTKLKQGAANLPIVNSRIINAVKSFGFAHDEYAVFGSALLEVYGIRASGDIDLFVTKKLYDQLAATPDWKTFKYDNGDKALKYQGKDMEVAFYECKWIPGCSESAVRKLISRAVDYDGVSFVSLEDTMKWKSALARPKDLKDVELIKNHLRSIRPSVGIGVYVIKDGKFLIGERIGAHGANTWCAPGGHLEYGESWEDCAVREVAEETGLKIKSTRFLGLTNDIFSEGKHYITISLAADWVSGEPTITEPDKCLGWRWVDLNSLPKNQFLSLEQILASEFCVNLESELDKSKKDSK